MSELLFIVHLTLAATWMGSMAYSLTVVQPKVDKFFPDEDERERFLVGLAQGNRWRVVALIAVLIATGLAIAISFGGTVTIGYTVSLVLYAIAASVFWYVSWRHWPARVFAVTEELAGYRKQLRRFAWTMVGLVGAGFIVALSVSVR